MELSELSRTSEFFYFGTFWLNLGVKNECNHFLVPV